MVTVNEGAQFPTAPINIAKEEPWVQPAVGSKMMEFLVDTGATHSVLNCKLTSLSKNAISVAGVSGQEWAKPSVPETTGMSDWGQKACTCLIVPFLY